MKKDKEWLRKESKKYYYLKDLGVSSEPKIMAREIENLIDQLDEPEKVVIPKFVADWIEKCKEDSQNLYGLYHFAPSKVSNWVFNDRTILIARAWLDGYTVEQPKLLTVIVKDYDKTIMSKQLPEDEVNKMMEGMEK